MSVDKRGNKLFVDFSQNDPADTLAAAYSVRPGKQPTVSTPLDWEELDLKLRPSDFTLESILARLLEKGDLWKEIGNAKIKSRNSGIIKKLLA